jgi:hypothetical protein
MSGRFIILLWGLSFGVATIAFVVFPPPSSLIVYFLIASAVIQTGHQLSPVALAWSNGGFREMMLAQPVRYLLIPAVAFASAVTLPFHWIANVYTAWNAYHYGMQNFGVLCLWRKPRQRLLAMAACLAVTVGPMVPVAIWHPQSTLLFAFATAMSFNHWIVDIGLSGRVSRHTWLFIGGVLLLGFVGFIWYEPTMHGMHRRSNELLPIAMGLGFVHFLYSGGFPYLLRMGVWRMSDPQVQATIGKRLSA